MESSKTIRIIYISILISIAASARSQVIKNLVDSQDIAKIRLNLLESAENWFIPYSGEHIDSLDVLSYAISEKKNKSAKGLLNLLVNETSYLSLEKKAEILNAALYVSASVGNKKMIDQLIMYGADPASDPFNCNCSTLSVSVDDMKTFYKIAEEIDFRKITQDQLLNTFKTLVTGKYENLHAIALCYYLSIPWSHAYDAGQPKHFWNKKLITKLEEYYMHMDSTDLYQKEVDPDFGNILISNFLKYGTINENEMLIWLFLHTDYMFSIDTLPLSELGTISSRSKFISDKKLESILWGYVEIPFEMGFKMSDYSLLEELGKLKAAFLQNGEQLHADVVDRLIAELFD